MPYSRWLSFEEFITAERQQNALEIWFLHLLTGTTGEGLERSARNRVDLGYRSPAARERALPDWEDPAWTKFEGALLKLDLGSPAGIRQAEVLAEELTSPAREERWKQEPGGEWPFGCIALEEPGTWDPDPQTVFFHIGNTLAPDSLLKNPAYIRSSLDKAARWALKNWGPGLVFTTETWLNSHPLWLSALPAEWAAGREEPNTDILWHLGFWGQFRTARGTFHQKNAALFRESGQMPFPVRRSRLEADKFRLK